MKHMYPAKRLLSLFLVLFTSGAFAQTYVMSNAPINSCNGFFYDPGGPNGNYGPNLNLTTTICPQGTSGTHIQLVFSAPQIGPGDNLCFYDGTSTAAPQLSCASQFEAGQAFIIQATAVNPSGCLTITFTSDGVGQGAGWSADINCVAACQLIRANLVNSTPAVMPADTGWIDVCPGQRVFFSGAGAYPQNGAVYNHSDLTSSFRWTFGDGGSAVGPNVSYVFEESGGYIVQLTITDQFGCKNTNFLTQRVRVSTQPTFNVGGLLDTEICAGDTIRLNSVVDTIDANYVLSARPTTGSFQSGGIRSDSLPLPDGTGVAFSTSISFTDFSPGQVLTNINDLQSICVNMEHSWLHDLEVRITCPSGQSVILHNFISPPTTGGAGETHLGIPVDPDPANHPNAISTPWGIIVPGVGWDYCWTPNATRGTWRQYATANQPGRLPSGDYNSFQPLTNLLGCPLNGEWTLTVIDRWAADNGFVFNWSIGFDANLYPRLESFTPQIVNYGWGPNATITYQTPDSLVAVPLSAGTASYSFFVTDNFGCAYDTSVTITVLPFTHPDCYDCAQNMTPLADALICTGQTATLNAGPVSSLGLEVRFETSPYAPFGFTNHPPANPFNSTINVNSIRPLTITNPAQQIISVCIDIETDWLADLRIFLRAPNGALLELTTNNGGSGDNYTSTCFSPVAVTPIQSGTPPFTGLFRPEGNWNVLNGSAVNGNWTIVASDGFGINDIGRFNWWSITFNSENNITYTWSPTAGLSCTTCPNPVASPSATTTYTVQTSDAYNCTYSQSATVSVVDDIPAPVVTCAGQGAGQLRFSWTPVGSQTQYEFREIINGAPGPWQGPVTALNHNVGNLDNGDQVTLEVRVYVASGPGNCPIAVGSTGCLYETCTLNAALSGSTQDVSCNGLNDGAATVSATGGIGTVLFFLDGNPMGQSSGVFNGLAAGPHSVVVEDSTQCRVTVDFTINQPAALQANIVQTQAISCHQGSNGVLTAAALGGNGGYQYVWNSGMTGAAISGLGAGAYAVSVTDLRGCQTSSAITITEPAPVSLQLNAAPIRCQGAADGSVSALPGGGVGSFTFTWAHTNSGQAQQIALGSGTYCVTATDANGCSISDCVTLQDPAPLNIDSLTLRAVSCFGDNNGQASVHVSGGTAPYTYAWDDPAQQLSATAVFLPPGLYAVTVTDQNGCTRIRSAAIQQPEPIEVGFVVTDPLCSGQSTGSAVAQVQGGTGSYSFLWENGQTVPVVQNLSEGLYRLTVTDGNGCTLETEVQLESPLPLALSVVQSFRGCFGQSDNEARATASGGTWPYSYTWNNGRQGSQAEDMASGLHTVTVTDANGCTLSGSVVLTDLALLQANIISDMPSCHGVADGALGVNIITGGVGGAVSSYTFQWSNNATGSVVMNLQGGLLYRLTVTDAQGCRGTAEKFLDEPALITFDLSHTDARCFGNADGTATVFNVRGDNTSFSFLWDAGAGSQTTAVASGLAAGRYTVTVTDRDGCSVTGEVNVAQPSEMMLQLDLTANRCFGNEEGAAKLTASGGTPGYTFRWPGNHSSSDISGLAAGSYVATVTDAQGCTRTIEAVITQPDPLAAEVSAKDVTCFGGRNGNITVGMSGGTPGYLFSLDNRHFGGAHVIVGLRAGYYPIYVKDSKGCTLLTEATVSQPSEFLVDAGPRSYIISLGDSVVLTAVAINGQGGVEFVWSAPYGNTLSCTECPVTVARPTDQITYELYGVDAKGCEATDLVTIYVEKERIALVPTGFTPNDDGNNDRLPVHGREGTRVLFFRIFDRWGQLVYQGGDFNVNDVASGWDGYFKGSPAPSGVYIWHIEVEYPDGVKETRSGQTTLIR